MNALHHALNYAEKLPGRLLPVIAGGKRPAIGDWVNKAERDEVALRGWFGADRHNVGWTPDRGVFVLDVDTKVGDGGCTGFDTLHDLESRFGTLPSTLSATTPTGGRHLLFRCNPDAPVKSIVGDGIGFHGLDVRASTGQIVVAPSLRPEGVYQWDGWNPLTDPAPEIAQAPEWLVKFACGQLKPDGTVVAARERQRVGDAEGKVANGGRNGVLVREAGAMRRRGWGYDAILEALTALSECQFEEPCEDKEIKAVARWACDFTPDEGADVANARDADGWRAEVEAAGDDVGALLAVAARIKGDTTLSRTESEVLLKSVAKRAGVSVKVLNADLSRPEAKGDRPVIRVMRNDFSGSVDDALRVLPLVPNLRVRSSSLVEVVCTPSGGASISPIPAARLAYLISGAARWNYGDNDGAPDPSILQAVLAAGYWPEVPELVGLLHQPTIKGDGTIIADTGNHDGLEAVFDASGFPRYAGSGVEALAKLRGLLSEFAFAGAGDEAAAVAAILTAVARPMLPTAPAFLVTAHDYGSGKTYLASLIAAFAAPDVDLKRWPQRCEEQDKGLFSILLEGRPVAVYDNLMVNWSSATLAAVLTTPTYSDRLLGGNTVATVSTRCLWLATGNGIKAAADLSRRVLTIELDARCETPWARSFQADPLATVQADRGRFVMLALRVLEDYLLSGSRVELSPLASYADWSSVVRGALAHYRLPDPVRAVSRNVEDDDERELLGRLLDAWQGVFGPEPVTLRDAFERCRDSFNHSPLGNLRCVFEDIAMERGEVSVRRLGNWMSARAGRMVGGKRLVAGEKTYLGVAWYVHA